MVGTALFAFGFIDFPIVALHAVKSGLAGEAEISLLYAAAMAADAFSALFLVGFTISTVPYLSYGLHCCRCLLCFLSLWHRLLAGCMPVFFFGA